MATIQQLKTQIQNANALGRTNLAEKGVELPAGATTYGIMTAIAEIVGGGSGTEYTSIVYNTDNTITLTDKDGVVHTMSCTYEGGKLIGVTYDGKAVDLTYNGDVLVKVGKTAVDVGNAPATSGATFNIAYGETAPEDTSKLWIKANEPANVSVDSNLNIIEKIVTSNTHLPTLNSDMGCAAVGTKIYLFGGRGGAICIFDTETETITTLSTILPVPVEHKCMGCAAVGTKIYLFGGYGDYHGDLLNTIYVFDTTTETISTLSKTLPTACHSMGCASVGTKIYLFGGSSTFGDSLNTINVFDTTTETISTLSTTLPTACKNMGCTSIGTKIYLFGGRGDVLLNTINVFDTTTETISTLSKTLPTAYEMMGCASIGTKIYLFGGFGGNSGNQINIFDTETETVTISPTKLSGASISMGCIGVNNRIYLFGGEIGYSTNQYLDTIDICYIAHQLAQGNIKIQSGSLTNKFNLINTKNTQIKIGVENVYIGNTNNEAELCEAYLHNGTEWVVIK